MGGTGEVFCEVVDGVSADVEGGISGGIGGCKRASVRSRRSPGISEGFYHGIRKSWRRRGCCFNVLGDTEKSMDLFIRQAFTFQKSNLACRRRVSYFLIL